ncbi:hypothetical protein EYF80_024253 [Liparis tanakae]|uniref:Uncharacterized protein n=1 Tax=Liparis tanakae TaxID=230148 RepID=A0A4Z2HJX2_9TELE|nr:hypothetical protein EYF80_024253 [Liparis tanakae]
MSGLDTVSPTLLTGGRNVGPNTHGLIRGPGRRLPAEDGSLRETLMLTHGLLSGDPSGKQEINRQVDESS